MAGPASRSISGPRASIASNQFSNIQGSGGPHTPIRTISSSFGSPSTLRAEEDSIILELGHRYLQAGFAGDASPKAKIGLQSEQGRRAGDYRKWSQRNRFERHEKPPEAEDDGSYELWNMDMRKADLGLIGDKVERVVREAFTKYLLIDSRARKIILVLPSALPLPLLSTVLNTLFINFQPPTISLMPAPVLTTVAAGVRASLVVDIGWTETVVTGVYDYREVLCRRSVRGTKLLCEEMLKLLVNMIRSTEPLDGNENPKFKDGSHQKVSFEECEEIVARLAWCRPHRTNQESDFGRDLSTMQEDIESERRSQSTIEQADVVTLPLSSIWPATLLRIPFSSLAEPCEVAYFAAGSEERDLDDEELPLHQLIYRTLVHLPTDVRSTCMSRLIFVGGGSNIPGLKSRVIDSVQHLIESFGWNPVRGKVVQQRRIRDNFGFTGNRRAQGETDERIENISNIFARSEEDISDRNPTPYSHELGSIENHMENELGSGQEPSVHGMLRAIGSLGSWSGASLLTQLKIPAIALVEREQWLQQGAAGASAQSEVISSKQRHSMGPGGLRPQTAEQTTWTLGPWA